MLQSAFMSAEDTEDSESDSNGAVQASVVQTAKHFSVPATADPDLMRLHYEHALQQQARLSRRKLRDVRSTARKERAEARRVEAALRQQLDRALQTSRALQHKVVQQTQQLAAAHESSQAKRADAELRAALADQSLAIAHSRLEHVGANSTEQSRLVAELQQQLILRDLEQARLKEALSIAREAEAEHYVTVREVSAQLKAALEEKSELVAQTKTLQARLAAGEQRAVLSPSRSASRIDVAVRDLNDVARLPLSEQEELMRSEFQRLVDSRERHQNLIRSSARGMRQYLILRVRVLMMLGFNTWVRNAASISVSTLRRNTLILRRNVETFAERLEGSYEQQQRVSALAVACFAGYRIQTDSQHLRTSAALALARWASCTRVHLRCAARWQHLARAARERLTPTGVPGGSGSRRGIRERIHREHLYYRRCFWNLKRRVNDAQRFKKAIFVVWKLWIQGVQLYEINVTAQCRNAQIHASAGPWWLQ
eukprot:3139713-Pleurochrysis_carterae.AAC.1